MLDKISRLKRKAAKHYQEYHSEADRMSCGKSIGEHVNPRMSNAKQRFNEAMDELSKIDPSCPASRL